MRRITIGGIGNVLLGDDGAGPYAVSLLQENYSFPDYVEIIDFGTPSLDLLEHIADSEAVILLDAAENGEPPGTVTRYTKEDVLRSDSAPRLDPHSPALGATLRAAELLGTAPASFLLLGITPEAIVAGSPLSACIVEAAKRAVQCVIAELQRLGTPVVTREVPLVSLRTRLLMESEAFAGSEIKTETFAQPH
ncbi:MAG TPA: hydrogenase maturation protease [Candidatus Angelobacter sp.]|nr:hydrogenase maturation protease [Candidatus Angelobacter sp.]